MRIAYVGNFQPLSVGETEIAGALEKVGHTVIRIPERSEISVVETMSEGCDLLLFAKFRCGTPNERSEFMRRFKGPKICWVFDLYWGL